ncbi:MAG: UDP-N-acetylmuramoylalanine--D-glutamate ligase [Bacteroidetes bacterium RIFCSPLOWO2_02_FULL_36_8]|nr:MAG: UDP-N-acetylmuramoylalanine--D-glutamate ligase [Bacteroidetes bacterium RIFCSPLOWO2_02_FULL_36_8]OFY70115.1 MAG: UDP-N-acetylmuramoylalanine--D-glutamate ligase [Bacteroidetes bacterium RIFCSPLOWO2_12_FULL_37_12]
MAKQNYIVILGGRESGVGAAILAKKQGLRVFVSDYEKIPDEWKKQLINNEINFEEGQHTLTEILKATEIIRSPGIPDKSKVIQEIREKNIPIIGEIEFAGRYSKAKMICVTGSNGKTTTVKWIYHILKKAGKDVALKGNVGASLSAAIAERDREYFVVELSSFQLEDMHKFRAHIAILLNITPDHLDRYGYKIENYIKAKFRIIRNQTSADYFIYNTDDTIILKELKKLKSKKMKLIPFSVKKKLNKGGFVDNTNLIFNLNPKQNFIMPLTTLALDGIHNRYNALASGLTSLVQGIGNPEIKEALMDFENVEHRLEPVCKVHGIEFINDSKATNVDSVWYALECTPRNIIWIAGGVDKGNDYSILTNLVSKKVKALVCLGIDNRPIHDAFSKFVSVMVNTVSMEEAVKMAYHLSDKGDTVLLSPACSSFDLFENFEDRGRQFKTAVRQL